MVILCYLVSVTNYVISLNDPHIKPRDVSETIARICMRQHLDFTNDLK